MNDYVPLGGRRRVLVGVLVTVIATDIAAVVVGLMDLRLVDRIAAGELVSDSELDANDDRVATVGLLQTVAYLAVVAAFIAWFHRAYRNLLAFGIERLRFRVGWAIGAWFVPILNLWRPKQIANDIWRASDPELPPNAGSSQWERRDVPALFLLWWICFLLSGLLGRAASSLSLGGGDEIAEVRRTTVLYLASDSFDIVAALLAIAVVVITTRRQEARAERLRAQPVEHMELL